MFAAVLIAFLVGGTVGVFLAQRLQRAQDPTPQTPRVQPASGSAETVDDVDRTLRSAVDQLSLGVVVADADGRVVYRNQPAKNLQGTHAGVLIDEHVDQVLATGRTGVRVDDQFVLQGPPKVILQLQAEPMPNGYSVATIEDVSERTRIDSMRTDFVANISHELKTPVGALAVLAEALAGETDPRVVDRVSGRMVEEAHRAVDAIDDLLELARIESAPRLDQEVELADIVDDAIARGRLVDEAKNVELAAMDSSDRIIVRCDSRQLVSAIGNLVENAVKYSSPDGIVQVRTRRDDRSIEIMVADQGDGIPHRDLDRIFERFYRVDRARSRETGGIGLGLSIVRHVAANHGGEVLVSSTEGEGSTFVLRLPIDLLVTQSEPPADLPENLVSRPTEGQQS